MSFNKVILHGNVGAAPEVRHLDGGSVVASFRLATSEYYKDKSGRATQKVEWHSIVCWGKTAEFVERHIQQGTALLIEGKLHYREFQTKDGKKGYATEILAETLQFAGGRRDDKEESNNTDMPY